MKRFQYILKSTNEYTETLFHGLAHTYKSGRLPCTSVFAEYVYGDERVHAIFRLDDPERPSPGTAKSDIENCILSILGRPHKPEDKEALRKQFDCVFQELDVEESNAA